MLDFFRRYQRYFFIVITVVIIISFSFFGTYSTLQSTRYREQVAFTAVNGTQVSRQELEELLLFLSTDMDDKLLFGGLWGPNFLNDGVIKKDFLQTGLAEVLAAEYPADIAEDLQSKLAKEKRYNLYVHPQAAFISTENAWTYFAPDMKKNYALLQKAQNPLDKDAFNARVRLFIGEKRFSPNALRQVLRYQEKQYNWVTPDANLDRSDLSLFGYHTLDDWFGPRFLRIVAEFIINSSIIAEQRGYKVSKDEVVADLVRNSDISFQQNLNNPYLGVANAEEYFKEQLRRMGMDRTQAVKVWQKVMLFRRLFQDLGSSVLVDPNSFQTFNEYAKEGAVGSLYELPKELRLGDIGALQKLEVYLSSVAKRGDDEKSLLGLPNTFYNVSEVQKKTPELVQKRYLLEIAHMNKNSLLPSIGLKETWNWEADERNWSKLKQQFPELGLRKAGTREDRFAALDSLDDKTRSKVDSFARSALLDEHPEWITKALDNVDPKRAVVGLRLKGGAAPFAGLQDAQPLMKLLDEAPLAGTEGQLSTQAADAQTKLSDYSADHANYYRIRVIERSPDFEVLTFAEANSKGVLDKLLDRDLEAFYQKIRAVSPDKFQNADKAWKSFTDVKGVVADQYFSKVLNAVKAEYAKTAADKGQKGEPTGDALAPWRLYAYVKEVKEKLLKDPQAAAALVQSPREKNTAEVLTAREPLADQWKLQKVSFHVDRSSEESRINKADALALGINDWSKVNVLPNGDLFFYQKTGKGDPENIASAAEKVDRAQRLLSDDVQQVLMKKLLQEIKARNAISLDYLNTAVEMTAPANDGDS